MDKMKTLYGMFYPYAEYDYNIPNACLMIHRELRNLCNKNMRHILLIIGQHLKIKYTRDTPTNTICGSIHKEIQNICLSGPAYESSQYILGLHTGIIDKPSEDVNNCNYIAKQMPIFGIRDLREFIQESVNYDDNNIMRIVMTKQNEIDIEQNEIDRENNRRIRRVRRSRWYKPWRHYKNIKRKLDMWYERGIKRINKAGLTKEQFYKQEIEKAIINIEDPDTRSFIQDAFKYEKYIDNDDYSFYMENLKQLHPELFTTQFYREKIYNPDNEMDREYSTFYSEIIFKTESQTKTMVKIMNLALEGKISIFDSFSSICKSLN